MKKSALMLAAGLGLATPLAVSTPVVHAATIMVGNNFRSGAGSLAEAAATAAANGTADTITFASNVTGTIGLDAGLSLGPGDSIVGPGPTVLTIDGEDTVRPLLLDNDGTVSISGLRFVNGVGVDGGCVSSSNTDLVLDNVYFESCDASIDGGAVRVLGGSLDATGLYVAANTAAGDGGGIWARDASVSVTTATFANNIAGVNGGALMTYSGPVLTGVIVSANTATAGYGGGINAADGVGMVMRRCTVSGNVARSDGGGLYVGNMQSNGSGLIASSVFQDNTAGQTPGTGMGGGMSLDLLDSAVGSGSFKVVDTTVTGNQADFYGGVVAMSATVVEVTIAFDTIIDNTAGDTGGEQLGLFMPAVVTHSVVSGSGDSLEASVSVGVERSLLGDQSVTYPDGAFVLDPWSSDHLGGAHGLGALQDNGGPTWTMKPTASSVLINGGATSLAGAPSYDARGSARRQGGRFDIGAVEWQTPSPPRNVAGSARPSGVRLSWQRPADRGDGVVLAYRIYQRRPNGTWSRVGTVAGGTGSFVVSGLVSGRLYRFKVVAVNAGGVGTSSASLTRRAG